MQDKQPNQQYVSNSLLNQLAQKAMEVAERDALIAEQQQEIELYKKKVEKLEGEKDDQPDKEKGDTNDKGRSVPDKGSKEGNSQS